MKTALARFVVAEDGATAIEYGLIVALIAVAAIGAFTALGNSVQILFGTTETGVGKVLAESLERVN